MAHENASGNGDAGDSPLSPSTELDENALADAHGQVFGRMMSTSLSMMGGVINPIAESMTPENLSELIAFTDRDSGREYDDRKHSRISTFLFGAFVLLLIVGLIFGLLLLASENLVRYVLVGVGGFIGGLGSGLGVAMFRGRPSA